MFDQLVFSISLYLLVQQGFFVFIRLPRVAEYHVLEEKMRVMEPYPCDQLNDVVVIDLYLCFTPTPVLKGGKLDSRVLANHPTINKQFNHL